MKLLNIDFSYLRWFFTIMIIYFDPLFYYCSILVVIAR